MKHAEPESLTTLQPILRDLRGLDAMTERTPGSFYLKSKAFLHFHEDPDGMFADVKKDLLTFTRYRVTTRADQKSLLALVKRCLNGAMAGGLIKGR